MADAVRSLHSCPQIERIIVVDNASGDDSVGVAEQSGADVTLTNATNVGFAKAVNRGVSMVDTARVLLLNPDACVDGGAVTALDAALDASPRHVIASPALVGDDGRVSLGAARFPTVAMRVALCLPLIGRLIVQPHLRPSRRVLRPGAVTPVDYLWGAVMLIDVAFLRRAGGFDERFFLFFEDEDLCRQARAQGLAPVLVGGAFAHHAGGASSGDAALREARRLFAAWQLVDKWEGRARADTYARGVDAACTLRVTALRAATIASSRLPIGVATSLPDRAGTVRRTLALFRGMLARGRAL